MSPRRLIFFMVGFVVLILLYSGMYTVSEGERGLLLRLGEIVNHDGKPYIVQPGLHFKMPFVTTLKEFDVRLQTLNVDRQRILTAEQKYVLVDYYAKWRIQDIPKFYKATRGSTLQAQQLLQQKINDALRAAFGRRDIKAVISSERGNIMDLLKQRADQSAQSLGIDVLDVRIQGIDLPEQVRDSVFERMRTEREQVATKYRSQGKAQAETIRAAADAEVAVTVAKARTDAQKVRASGDATAAGIYSKAYQKNAGFYAFYRSLQAYQQVFDHNQSTVMVLRPRGEFFRYFLAGKKAHSKP